MRGSEIIVEKNYTIKNFWWRWLACEVSLVNTDSIESNELTKWCKENTTGKWERIGLYKFIFLKSDNALAFKLRWYE